MQACIIPCLIAKKQANSKTERKDIENKHEKWRGTRKMDTITVILACSGFWAVINTITAYLIAKRQKQDEAKIITKSEFETLSKAVRGLLYGELERRCTEYIVKGEISASELDDLRKYYYEPYASLEGDGTIESLFHRVETLKLTK